MGLRPTRRNESQDVTPAKAGVRVREELDSRFRGNDVTFDGAQRSISVVFRMGLARKELRRSFSRGCGIRMTGVDFFAPSPSRVA
jgi:hypothetical protein